MQAQRDRWLMPHQLSLMYFQGPIAVFFSTASVVYATTKQMFRSDSTLVYP